MTNVLDSLQKWTLRSGLKHGGYHYGLMTINIVECINMVLKGVRMLPIITLLQMIFYH